MGENSLNVIKVINPEVIFKNIIELLIKKFKVECFGKNPYYLCVEGIENYIFIRNLTRAYPLQSPDVCRIQLPKTNRFLKIMESPTPFLVLGYCEQYNTFASWSSKSVKPRLNSKSNVSLYSRFSDQVPVKTNIIREFKLSNGEIVKIVDFNDVELLLFDDINFNSNLTDTFNEIELKNLISDKLSDCSDLEAIQICISYFEKHKKEYDLLLIRDIILSLRTKQYFES